MRSALVTGASTGIGRATTLHLDGRGWRVFAGVRREEDAASLREAGSEHLTPLTLDVTDAAQIAAAAARVGEEVGEAGLDGLVNNAGIAIAAPLEFLPPEELRHQLEVNLVGQVAVTHAFLPALRRAAGRIVFVGSIAGKSALPFLSPYAASKHALEAVADSLRLELRPFGIRVSIVEPGSIRTAIWARSAQRADELIAASDGQLGELYGARMAAFRQLALKRGAGGAPAQKVAKVVVEALTTERPHTRYLVGRDARLRAAFERLPSRLRDRILERVLLKS
jgi:NAD(P)-dependent dehydrogenase (short-subunit alcohol dehydrogenase family)